MPMNPGIGKNLDFGGIGWQEDQIIRKLGQTWFISFIRNARFKESDYVLAFAKPTERLERDFHLDREVLVLFTPYKDFQPRALDFVDKTLSEFQNRLDKLCILLISGDENIRDKIRQMAVQDKELRIIVPFSYAEFTHTALASAQGFVLGRLKEFFYTRDLFALDSPLKSDTYFFGRNQFVQQLYGKYRGGENGGLFGLRKIGKTSVLYAVKRYLDLREEPVVFLDCAEPSFHARRWYEALHFIVDNFVRLAGLESKVEIAPEPAYTEKDASVLFERDLFGIQSVYGKKRLLIILDEIENITFELSPSEQWCSGKDYVYFWQALRAIYQKNPDLFSVIVAGVNPKAIETGTVQGYDNPIFHWVTPTYLPLFNVSEVKEMVSSIGNYMGLLFDNEVFTYLSDDFGGHPFLIRQVCSRIHQRAGKTRPISVSKYQYQSEKGDLNNHVQNYIGLIVNCP